MSAIQDLPLSAAMRGESAGTEWLFPIVETVHVLTLTIVFGSIAMVDLRLVGLTGRGSSISRLSAETLPWTWTAFAIAALAGMLMFSSKALIYYGDIPFRLKMVCLLLAGINMAMFHWLGTRHLEAWDRGRPPRAAKLAGGASLLLWTTIVAAGRWVGFTT